MSSCNLNELLVEEKLQQSGCLTGDTLVKLANGTLHTLEEMYKNKDFYIGSKVYSYNVAFMKPEFGIIEDIIMVPQRRVVSVTLSEIGKVDVTVKCTYDHKFLSASGVYWSIPELFIGCMIQTLSNELPDYKSIKDVKVTNEISDVYDLVVSKYHNYGTVDTNGDLIFSHNNI